MWEVIRVEITPVAAVASTLFVALTVVLFAWCAAWAPGRDAP